MDSKNIESLSTKMRKAIEDGREKYEEYNALSEKEKRKRFIEYVSSPIEPKEIVITVSPKVYKAYKELLNLKK